MQESNKPLIKHIPTFLEYCEVEKGLSPVSSKNYHNFLKVFISWLEQSKLSNLLPHQLTAEHIWNYRLYLSRKQDYKGAYLKKTSQSYYLRALRNLLKYLTDKDIVTLPSEKIKLPKLTDKDKQIKFLNFDQIEKLKAQGKKGELKLSEDRLPIKGGVVLGTGDIKKNASLEVILENIKDEIETQLNQFLFAKNEG